MPKPSGNVTAGILAPSIKELRLVAGPPEALRQGELLGEHAVFKERAGVGALQAEALGKFELAEPLASLEHAMHIGGHGAKTGGQLKVAEDGAASKELRHGGGFGAKACGQGHAGERRAARKELREVGDVAGVERREVEFGAGKSSRGRRRRAWSPGLCRAL